MVTAERRAGRPTALTDEVRDELVGRIASGEPRAAAAAAVGITGQTLRNWVAWGEDAPESEYGEFVIQLRMAEIDALPEPGDRPKSAAELNA